MKYYRIAIVAPMEYAQDDPTWRCLEDLRLAGHAAEVVDPRLFPGSVGVDGQPDAQVLAAFLEQFRPDYVSTGGQTADEIVEQLRSNPQAGSESPAQRFVVFGYVGPGNFGDELIFSVICQQIGRRFPNSYVSLIGHDPVATLRRHGVVSVATDKKLEADVMLSGARALVFMAGIMFDDPFVGWTAGPIDPYLNPRSEIGGQAAFTLMAAARGVPAVFLGIGAGPLENSDAQRLVRLEAAVGARYFPRDGETERLLLDAGVPKDQVHRKADLAFLADAAASAGCADALLAQGGLKPGCYLAVALRDHRTVPEGFVETIAAALDRVVESRGISVAFVNFAPEDGVVHERVRAAMRCSDRAYVLDTGDDEEAVIDLLARAAAACAMRLHCSIVANACGVPSVGFDYNEKVAAFYELMGRDSLLVPMDADDDRIADAIGAALEEGGCAAAVLSPDAAEDAATRGEREAGESHAGLVVEATIEAGLASLSERASVCRALASEAFDELERIVFETNPPLERRTFYARSVSIEELELRDVRARLSAADQELSAARARIAELEDSTAWKVGRGITAAPRKIKDALHKER